MKLLSLAPDQKSNITIAAEPAPGVTDADLPAQASALTAQLRAAGLTVNATHVVTLAQHRALEVDGSETLRTPTGGVLHGAITEYYLAANDLIYVVALNGTAPELQTILGTLSVSTP